jgi:coenzyme F420-reducing hydrogenase alpha subunit
VKQGNTIVIDPVTRIEGHSKITLHLNEDGRVEDARFHVTQFRGFEKLCDGRPFYEMPSLMARICGICPVSHLIASAKACDSLLAVKIPPTADKLRRIFGLAQVTQSHALSLFHLSSAWTPILRPATSLALPKRIRNSPSTASACASLDKKSSSASEASASTLHGSFPAASVSL